MGHYDALIAAWNSPTQPPTGVTGTGLTPAMTTQQKMDAVNGWTMTGQIPASFYVTGDQLANCVNWTEFNALAAPAQTTLLSLFTIPGQLLGGSSNTSFLPLGMCLAAFPAGTTTRASLTALAKGIVRPWWEVPAANGGGGLTSPVNANDLTAAGLV